VGIGACDAFFLERDDILSSRAAVSATFFASSWAFLRCSFSSLSMSNRIISFIILSTSFSSSSIRISFFRRSTSSFRLRMMSAATFRFFSSALLLRTSSSSLGTLLSSPVSISRSTVDTVDVSRRFVGFDGLGGFLKDASTVDKASKTSEEYSPDGSSTSSS